MYLGDWRSAFILVLYLLAQGVLSMQQTQLCRRQTTFRLPDQSAMSRRLPGDDTQAVLTNLLDRLESAHSQQLIWRLDGKALAIAKVSFDRQARMGRGSGGFENSYRFYAIYALNNRPLAYDVYPMNVDDRVVARQMIAQLPASEGYLLAGSYVETNPLYDQSAAAIETFCVRRILVSSESNRSVL